MGGREQNVGVGVTNGVLPDQERRTTRTLTPTMSGRLRETLDPFLVTSPFGSRVPEVWVVLLPRGVPSTFTEDSRSVGRLVPGPPSTPSGSLFLPLSEGSGTPER